MSKNTDYTSTDEYLGWILKSFKTRLFDLIEEYGFEMAINNKSMKEIPIFVSDYYNFDNEFNELIPPDYDKIEYNLRIWKIFAHELTFEGTGVIIAGFDKIHHYPSFFVFNIYCNDNGKIIFEDIESRINCEESLIRVFAMNEEAYSFISGVSDDFENSIKDFLNYSNNTILSNMKWFLKNENIKNKNKILSILKNELDMSFLNLEKRITNYKLNTINYTSNSCEFLPRQILCDLANSLIELTALKQKISLDLETVSKESDITLITKSNNLKWVKYTRK